MLDELIIEKLRRDEEFRRQDEARPRLQIPMPPPEFLEVEPEKDEVERGVVTIEVWGEA
jgi:hypothetical protein